MVRPAVGRFCYRMELALFDRRVSERIGRGPQASWVVGPHFWLLLVLPTHLIGAVNGGQQGSGKYRCSTATGQQLIGQVFLT